jgi:ABC-type uncharacterized transport system ATPase subunit
MSDESDALKIDSLSKSFGGIKAVRSLSLNVKKEKPTGFLRRYKN